MKKPTIKEKVIAANDKLQSVNCREDLYKWYFTELCDGDRRQGNGMKFIYFEKALLEIGIEYSAVPKRIK